MVKRVVVAGFAAGLGLGCASPAPAPASSADAAVSNGAWRTMPPSMVPFPNAEDPFGVSTGEELLVWGRSSQCSGAVNALALCAVGARFTIASDSWTALSPSNQPAERHVHTGVWTGARMLVWGGEGCDQVNGPCPLGGSYDPRSDTWDVIEAAPISPRTAAVSVWTGAEMIVFGGAEPIAGAPATVAAGGARYDPSARSWARMAESGAPTPRGGHTAVWSGRTMIVWGGGGADNEFRGDGASYDPATDSWMPISNDRAPQGRIGHHAVWADDRMIIWGGRGCTVNDQGPQPCDNGGAYDPKTDTWSLLASAGAPSGSGDSMIAWGQGRLWAWGGEPSARGAAYDPRTDAWSPLSAPQPSARVGNLAFWIAGHFVVWGGIGNDASRPDGALYQMAQ